MQVCIRTGFIPWSTKSQVHLHMNEQSILDHFSKEADM